MVVLDAKQQMDEMISVDIHQIQELYGVSFRVRIGSEIDRCTMLLLALMSYLGGYGAFINAINAKAHTLGMIHTHYVEPTGLSVHNVSTARDPSELLMTKNNPLLSELSAIHETMAAFRYSAYTLPFRNTNHLVYRND